MIEPVYDKQGVTIYHGDSVEVMRSLPADSVDSIVTDPPYGIRFMGKAWDGVDIEKQTATRRDYKTDAPGAGPQGGHNSKAVAAGKYDLSLTANQAFAEWTRVWAVEALRILKPGGHMLVFCGPRTYHRMASGVEDAGFEIRDQILWIYGSGFPKSHDISKAIDKAAGAEREVVGKRTDGRYKNGFTDKAKRAMGDPAHATTQGFSGEMGIITAPATPEAEAWDGWGTALKPAHEPIVVARKPLIGTVAENVLKHGTGGINIDGGRVGTSPQDALAMERCNTKGSGRFKKSTGTSYGRPTPSEPLDTTQGRFPANIILDAEAGAMLDKQSGESVSQSGGIAGWQKDGYVGGKYEPIDRTGHNDSGGASRFFYCAKASKQDRDEGLEGMPLKECGMMEDDDYEFPDGRNTIRRNVHPTVKPTALMQYLVRLVTPPSGTTYDPFMGSGSTGKAAVREGFKFIGSEREAEYIPISIARINAPAQVELL